jgi:hypothetical protein
VIIHVVTFTWRDDAPADIAEHVSAALATLPGQIPELRAYRYGSDLGLGGNADYAVVAEFDDVDGWRAYDQQPEHVRIKTELILPAAASRAAAQFRT